jgi:acyl-CoA thioester hydrolase
MMLSHVLKFRAHYHETDGQGRVHHANYLNYFERGRVELLRAAGASYRAFEASGLLLVVSEMRVRYHAPAAFDDWLTLSTEVVSARGARIIHRYRLSREDGTLLVEGESTIACVDREGHVRRLPASLLALSAPDSETRPEAHIGAGAGPMHEVDRPIDRPGDPPDLKPRRFGS